MFLMCSCVGRLDEKVYKILTYPIVLRTLKEAEKMHLFRLNQHEEKLRCPYKGCEKTFDKPVLLTDNRTIPRQSYYACPYCMSRIEIVTENMKIKEVKPTDYPTVLDSPAKCAHYSGLLNNLPADAPLPDECLICPKILQCDIRRK
jgi:DNA-directed RNA polymerase subunit RPC12/RpoP